MKVCVFGAGAIGGFIAARLAKAGCAASVVARGAHLRAIRKKGLTLIAEAQRETFRVNATDDAAELGVQDVVIIAVKTTGLISALPSLQHLIGPETTIVPAMNGVPWWFFSGFGGALEGLRLENLDPGGAIAAAIPEKQIVGCVVYPTANIPEPGVIHHTGRLDLYFGAPDGSVSRRAQAVHDLLARAGFKCRLTADIRREIWTKLVGNASFNPVSALTCATLDRMLTDPDVYRLLTDLMHEVIEVGRGLGLTIDEDPRERLERGRPLGAVKFSMLQDLEQNRPLEFEALTGAVVFIARRAGIRVPNLDAVHGLIRVRAAANGV